jgi:hypothetical protein
MSRDIILKVDVYVCNYENVLDRLGWRQKMFRKAYKKLNQTTLFKECNYIVYIARTRMYATPHRNKLIKDRNNRWKVVLTWRKYYDRIGRGKKRLFSTFCIDEV